MPRKLSQVLNLDTLSKMIAEGFISVRESGDGRKVYNYTPAAAHEQIWNRETLNCRGLVTNDDDEIIARPFPKFFNLDQYLDAGHILPQCSFEVSDKMDGSLIIAYPWKDSIGINTRGSFESTQAIDAMNWLLDLFPNFRITKDDTWLMEWVGPSNRIVLSYPEPELVLLDIMGNYYGKSVLEERLKYTDSRKFLQGIRIAPRHKVTDINDLVGVERDNQEGFVVKYSNDLRIKIKHEHYVHLHRILTHVTPKTIWGYLAENDEAARNALLDVAPDEFYKWITEQENAFKSQALALYEDIQKQYASILYVLDAFATTDRKAFASLALKSGESSLLFTLLDASVANTPNEVVKKQEKLHSQIWDRIKPVGEPTGDKLC